MMAFFPILTVGTSGQQHELLEWLDKVTFPMEAKFKDVAFAKRVYKQVVRTFIDAGVRISLLHRSHVLIARIDHDMLLLCHSTR